MKVLTLYPNSTAASQGNWSAVNSESNHEAVNDATTFAVATIPDLNGNTYYAQAQDLYQFFTAYTYMTQPTVGNRSSNAVEPYNPNDGTPVVYQVSNITSDTTTARFAYTNSVGAYPNPNAYITVTGASVTGYNAIWSISATSVLFTGNLTSTSATITGVSSTTNLIVGATVTNDAGLPSATIASIGASTVTLSASATATVTGVVFTAQIFTSPCSTAYVTYSGTSAVANQYFASSGGDYFTYVEDISKFRKNQIVAILEGLQDGKTPYSPVATSTDAFYSEWLQYNTSGLIPTVPYKQSVDIVDFPTSSLMLPQGYGNISSVMSPNLSFYNPPANKYLGQFISPQTSTTYLVGQSPTPYSVGYGQASPMYVATSGDSTALFNFSSILPDATAAAGLSPTISSIVVGTYNTQITVSSTTGFAVGQTITVAFKPTTTLTPASMGWNAGKVISISGTFITTDLNTQTSRGVSGKFTTSNMVLPLPNAGFSAVVNNGSNLLMSPSSTAGLVLGQSITDATNTSFIPNGSYITAISSTAITISQNATGNSTVPNGAVTYTATLGGGNYISTTSTVVGLNQTITQTTAFTTGVSVTAVSTGTSITVNGISATLVSGATFTASATFTAQNNPSILISTTAVLALPYLSPAPTGWANLTGTGLTGGSGITAVDSTGYGVNKYRVGITPSPVSYTASATFTSTVSFTASWSYTAPTGNTLPVSVTSATIGSTAYTVNSSGSFTVGSTTYNISTLLFVGNSFTSSTLGTGRTITQAPTTATSHTFTGTLSASSPNITGISSTAGLVLGQSLSSASLSANTYYIQAFSGTNTIVMNQNASVTGTTTGVTFTAAAFNANQFVLSGGTAVAATSTGQAATATTSITGSTGRTILVTTTGTTQDNILSNSAFVTATGYIVAGNSFASGTRINSSSPYEYLLTAPVSTTGTWTATAAVSANFTGTTYSSSLTFTGTIPMAGGDSITVYNGTTLLSPSGETVSSVSGTNTVLLSSALTAGVYQTFGTSVTGSVNETVDEMYAAGQAVGYNSTGTAYTASWSSGTTAISVSSTSGSGTAGVYAGMSVQAAGIPAGATVVSVSGTATVNISATTTASGTSSVPLSITNAVYNFAPTNGYQSSWTSDGFVVSGLNSYYTNNQADGSFLNGMTFAGNNIPANTTVQVNHLQDEFVSGQSVSFGGTVVSTTSNVITGVSSVIAPNGLSVGSAMQGLAIGQAVTSGTLLPTGTVITDMDTVGDGIHGTVTLSHYPSSSGTFTFSTSLFPAQTFTVTGTYYTSYTGMTAPAGILFPSFSGGLDQRTGLMLGMIVGSSAATTSAVITGITKIGGFNFVTLSNALISGASAVSETFTIINGYVSLSNASTGTDASREIYTIGYSVPQSNALAFGATIDGFTTRLNTDSQNKFDSQFFTAPYLSIDGYNNPNHGQFLIMPVIPKSIQTTPIALATGIASHTPSVGNTVYGVSVFSNPTPSINFLGTAPASSVTVNVSDPTGGTFYTTFTGSTTISSATMTVSSTANLSVGQTVSGTGVSASTTTILSISGTSITLSAVATSTVTSGTFYATSISSAWQLWGFSFTASASHTGVSWSTPTAIIGITPSATGVVINLAPPYTGTSVTASPMYLSPPLVVADITGLSVGQQLSSDATPFTVTGGTRRLVDSGSGSGTAGPYIYSISQTAQTVTYTGDITFGSAVIQNIVGPNTNSDSTNGGTDGLMVGQDIDVSYTGFPAGTTIVSVNSESQITVSNTALFTVAQDTITFDYYTITLGSFGSVSGGTVPIWYVTYYTGYSIPSGGYNIQMVAGGNAGVSNTLTLTVDTLSNVELSPVYQWQSTASVTAGYNGIYGVSYTDTLYINVGDAVFIPSNLSSDYSTSQSGYGNVFVSAVVSNGSTYTVFLEDNLGQPITLLASGSGSFATYTPNYVYGGSRLAVLETYPASDEMIVWSVDGNASSGSSVVSYPNSDNPNAIYPLEQTVSYLSAFTTPTQDGFGAGVITLASNIIGNHATNTVVASCDEGDRYFGSTTVGDLEVLTPITIGSLFGTTLYDDITTASDGVVIAPLNNTSNLVSGSYYDQYGNPASQGAAVLTSTTVTGCTTIAGQYYIQIQPSTTPVVGVGWQVHGTGIPSGTIVTYLEDIYVLLSNPVAVDSTTASYTFTPSVWGVMVVGQGNTQETVIFNGQYNFLTGSATGNTITPISIGLASGQKFRYNHFAGEPVFVSNLSTTGFANQHAAGAPILGGADDQTTKTSVQTLTADNTAGGEAIALSTTLGLSPNWLQSGNNGISSLGTTLAKSAPSGSTSLYLKGNNVFPANVYGDVYQLDNFFPHDIGRIAGAVASGTTVVPIAPSGYPAPTNGFFARIGTDIVQVSGILSVASTTVSPSGFYMLLASPTNISYQDGTPVSLRYLDTATPITELTVPSFYLNRSFSGIASTTSASITGVYENTPLSGVVSGPLSSGSAGSNTYTVNGTVPSLGMTMFGDSGIQASTVVVSVSGSTVTLSLPFSQNLTSGTIYFGYEVAGNGIPAGAYISSTSGTFSSGTGTVTLQYASGQPAYPTVNGGVTLNSDASLYSDGEFVYTIYTTPLPAPIPAGATIYLKYGPYGQEIFTTVAANAGDTSISVTAFPVYNFISTNVNNGVLSDTLSGFGYGTRCSYGLITPLHGDQVLIIGSGTTAQEITVENAEPTATEVVPVAPFLPFYNYDDTIASGSFTANTTFGSNQITFTLASPFTGNITAGNNLITGVSTTANLFAGQVLSATGIPLNSYIVSFSGTNALVMSAYATATATATITPGGPLLGAQLIPNSSTTTFTASVSASSKALTGVSSTAGLAVGMEIASAVSFTGTITTGSATITGISSTANLFVGEGISGTGIPSTATIASFSGTTALIMSAVATTSATETISSNGVAPSTLDNGFLESFIDSFSGTNVVNLYDASTVTATSVTFTGSYSVFGIPAFVSSVSGSTITVNAYADATVTGATFNINPTTLSTSVALTLGNETLSEIVYPYTTPVLQADGTYLITLASPTVNGYDANTNISYYSPPGTPSAGDTRYVNSTNSIEVYDGTRWNTAEISDISVTVGMQASQNNGSQVSVSLVDFSTGDVSPADTYINPQVPPTY